MSCSERIRAREMQKDLQASADLFIPGKQLRQLLI